MTMDELIQALEKATGADRELDKAIQRAIEPWLADAEISEFIEDDGTMRWRKPNDERGPDHWYHGWIGSYTSSIDAALTLVPAKFHWTLYDSDGGTNAYAQVEPPEWSIAPWDGTAATPALALCIAALKARKQP